MSLTTSISRRLRARLQDGKPRLKVGVAGDDPFAGFIVRAYAADLDVEPSAVWHPDPKEATARAKEWGFGAGTVDFAEFLGRVDAVELLAEGPEAGELARAALRAGKHLSMRRPFARSLAEADELLALARPDRVFRVLDDAVFYAPHRRMAALLEQEEIGEVSNVRFACRLAGSGGPGLALADLSGEYLFCDPFDKFGLAVSLFGRVAAVQGYLNPMDANRGGQGAVLVKFGRESLYGEFDFTFSPAETIRSNFYPAHEQVEAAGTGGYIWVNGFSSPGFEPAIAVRLPNRYYQIGVESSMDIERTGAYPLAVRDFVDGCLRGRPSVYPAILARHALAVQLASLEAARTGRIVEIR